MAGGRVVFENMELLSVVFLLSSGIFQARAIYILYCIYCSCFVFVLVIFFNLPHKIWAVTIAWWRGLRIPMIRGAKSSGAGSLMANSENFGPGYQLPQQGSRGPCSEVKHRRATGGQACTHGTRDGYSQKRQSGFPFGLHNISKNIVIAFMVHKICILQRHARSLI